MTAGRSSRAAAPLRRGASSRRPFDVIKAAVADEPSHDDAVLLLNECLVILVGARPRHLDLTRPTPWSHDVVHECASGRFSGNGFDEAMRAGHSKYKICVG